MRYFDVILLSDVISSIGPKITLILITLNVFCESQTYQFSHMNMFSNNIDSKQNRSTFNEQHDYTSFSDN